MAGLLPCEWLDHVEKELSRLRSHHLLRETTRNDRDVSLQFASNDYLGLAQEARRKTSSGMRRNELSNGENDYRGSILISGYSRSHEELEEKLLHLKGMSARSGASALLFPSGYAANMSVAMSLCCLHPGQDDCLLPIHVFSDQLNHASIIDGIKYAKAKTSRVREHLFLHVYKHNDMEDLKRKLEEIPEKASLKIVISESVFSMDGDACDLKEIVSLKKRFNFLLVVDEAHATLVLGSKGGGLAQALGLSQFVDITVGTLSKAVGSFGGFIVSQSPALRSIVLNKGRSVIYSTALPVAQVRCAIENIEAGMSDRGCELRRRLKRNVCYLREGLVREGFDICGGGGGGVTSPIIPVMMRDEEYALRAQRFLRTLYGIFVPCIRPPTVPTARLRITVNACHTHEQLHLLIRALSQFKTLPSKL